MFEVQAELEEEIQLMELEESRDDALAAEAEKLAHEQEMQERLEKEQAMEMKRMQRAREEAEKAAAAAKE